MMGQLLLSMAFKYANASTVSPLININCLFNVFIDLFYFKFDFYLTDLVGSIIIMTCICLPVIVLLHRHSKSKAEAAATNNA